MYNSHENVKNEYSNIYFLTLQGKITVTSVHFSCFVNAQLVGNSGSTVKSGELQITSKGKC